MRAMKESQEVPSRKALLVLTAMWAAAWFCLTPGCSSSSAGQADLNAVQLYHVHDFELTSGTAHENPFRVNLSATFTHESGMQIAGLPGFYDGGKTWKIRFSPTALGCWKGVTVSDDPLLNGIKLPAFQCVLNTNHAVHGGIRVDSRYKHRFIWSDGTAFVPLGFELDWLAAFHQRLGQPKGKPVDRKDNRFSPAMDLLVERGFNYLVSNLYAYRNFSDPVEPYALTPPDMYCFGGTNEKPDFAVLNVDFFKDFDGAIAALHERGIAVDLMIQVQNKGVRWPEHNSWQDDDFWRYVVARYQAYGNIVWDVSKETFRLLKGDPNHTYALGRIDLIRKNDAYKHLVIAHDPGGQVNPVDAVCDYVSDQRHLSGEYEHQAVIESALKYNRDTIRRLGALDKPYVNVEFGYERGVEPIRTIDNGHVRPWQDMLIWTYAIYAGGGHANYYYNNTSWNLVKFSPEPESWRRYRYLRDLLNMMDLGPMAPNNGLVERGMCLAEPGRQYFIFLPEGGGESVDLSTVPQKAQVRCAWTDIFTGKTVQVSIQDCKAKTALTNPLPDKTQPCAVYIKVERR